MATSKSSLLLVVLLTYCIAYCFALPNALVLPRSSDAPQCRCFPGDACWPTDAEWTAFNTTLGGKLIKTIPIGHVCHNSEFGPYDAAACASLRARWPIPETDYQTTHSPMSNIFANNSCNPFDAPDTQCIVGAYVPYAVRAMSASDVQTALSFVKKHNLRPVIRNTGHDYMGKSSGPGGLAIWMHNMKDISFMDYQSPFYSGKAMKAAAGVQVFEAEYAAYTNNLIVVGGDCPTVGLVGGFTQGGGHGPLSSTFGMGADQVLEWEVVTSNGTLVTASRTQNEDLYWALTGGGGGTYGVVMSMTAKAHQNVMLASATLNFTNKGVSQDTYYNGVMSFIKTLPAVTEAGAACVWLHSNDTFSLNPLNGPNITQSKLDSLMLPLLRTLNSTGIKYQYSSQQFASFYRGLNATDAFANITEFSIGGRMLPRSSIETDQSTAALNSAMRVITDNGGTFSGVGFNVTRFATSSNSVNPIWRTGLFHAVFGIPWDFPSFGISTKEQQQVTDQMVPAMEKITPGGGAYLNEGDFQEANWKQAFYGVNYDRLNQIKMKWDPEHLFYGPTAVGSDYWTQRQDGRLCKAS